MRKILCGCQDPQLGASAKLLEEAEGGEASGAKRRGRFAKASADARIWVCQHSAGGVHCGAEDGGGIVELVSFDYGAQ